MLAGLSSFDLYMPAQGPSHDPYNHDGAGPAMMLMLDFASRDDLAAAVNERQGIAAVLGSLPAGFSATGAAFERRFYPVGEDDEASIVGGAVLLCGALSSSGR